MYSLINLKDLYISNNNLSGVIHNDIQNLQSLERLKILNNQFSNTLPIEICNLNLDWSNPANFSVSNNKFCAPYPGCLNGYEGNQDTSNCNQVSIIHLSDMEINFSLNKVFPNPFNSATVIEYILNEDAMVEIHMVDLMGRNVKTLFQGYDKRGLKTISWRGEHENGTIVPTGIYFCILNANNYKEAKKIMFLQ